MFNLKKDNVEISIKALGAEIKSFRVDGEEMLWNREEYWAKSSPILFPFVGTLKDFKYKYKGKEYEINTRHGFARDNIFEVFEKKEDSITFKFSSNENTLKNYPFEFNLYVKYDIIKNGFSMEYIVENLSSENMYFSIGAHPAFLLDDNYENNNYISFEKEEDAEKYILNDKGLLIGKEKYFSIRENKQNIDIKDYEFKNDAIIFKNLKSKKIYLKNRINNNELAIEFEKFPYIAFWKVLNAPFICVEPWFGITDSIDTNSNIEEKEGIEKLSFKESFSAKLIFEFKKGN